MPAREPGLADDHHGRAIGADVERATRGLPVGDVRRARRARGCCRPASSTVRLDQRRRPRIERHHPLDGVERVDSTHARRRADDERLG